MTCPRCGLATPAGSAFCTNCGAPLAHAASAVGPTTAASTVAVPVAASAAMPAAAPAPQRHAGAAERSLFFLALAAVGGLGLALCTLLLVVLAHDAPTPVIFAVAVVMAILPVPIYACLITCLDRHVREPGWLLAAAFFWGAFVAVSIALLVNTGVEVVLSDFVHDRSTVAQLGASFSAPLVEETAKGLALLLIFLFLRPRLNDVVDGIVIGALVGLGFAMTENVKYFAGALAHGGLAGAAVTFYIRVVLNGLGHSMYTAATGAGLGLAAETSSPNLRVAAPILGWFAAMFMHFSWNTFFDPIMTHLAAGTAPLLQLFVIAPFVVALLVLPGMLTLFVITVLAWRRESAVITEYLRDEVASGVVLPGEYALLQKDRARAHRVWHALFTQGPAAWHFLRQIYNEEAALAFRKWHTANGEQLPSYARAQSEDAYRQRIVRLRAQLQSLGVATA